MQIKQRFDKEILEELPKLKFLHKKGIQPDYEDKDIEKPRKRVKVTSFDLGAPKDFTKLIPTPLHSLDFLDMDKLLKDKALFTPGCHSRAVPIFSKQLTRQQVENQRKGISIPRKPPIDKLDEDLWLERINLYAQRATEINKIIKDDLEKYKLRDTSNNAMNDSKALSTWIF